MRYLRTNTATRVTVGPFLDKTDGITPELALTATNEHLTLIVDTAGVPTLVLDADATASGGDNDFVHVPNDDAGFYDLEFTAAQTNYLGRAMLSINYVTDHCPVFQEFMILPANVYDSLVLGSDLLDANTAQWLGTAVTLSSNNKPDVNVDEWKDIALATTNPLPNAAPGASTGLLISGSNSGTTTLGALTVTGAFTVSDGVIVTASTLNRDGIEVTGNGTGHGMFVKSGDGATGNGIYVGSLATNGEGIKAQGAGTGSGISGTGGATNAPGVYAEGAGTGHGVYAVSGVGATGNGIHAESLATNGSGVVCVGTGTGKGLILTGGATLGAVAGTSITLSGTLQAATITSTGATTFNSLVVSTTTTLTGNVSCGAAFDVVGALTCGTFATDTTFDVGTGLTVGGTFLCNIFATTSGFSIGTALTVGTTTTLTGAVTANNAGNAITVDMATWLGTAVATPNVAGVPKVDVVYANGLAATLDTTLAQMAAALTFGTVDTTNFAPTTTEFEADDITEATADHFNGRIIVFTSGALSGQACEITDYSLATGRGHFTVSLLTEAPANDITFTIF